MMQMKYAETMRAMPFLLCLLLAVQLADCLRVGAATCAGGSGVDCRADSSSFGLLVAGEGCPWLAQTGYCRMILCNGSCTAIWSDREYGCRLTPLYPILQSKLLLHP